MMRLASAKTIMDNRKLQSVEKLKRDKFPFLPNKNKKRSSLIVTSP